LLARTNTAHKNFVSAWIFDSHLSFIHNGVYFQILRTYFFCRPPGPLPDGCPYPGSTFEERNPKTDYPPHSILQTQSVLFGHGIAIINPEKPHLFTP
jgi:hypothetical protein